MNRKPRVATAVVFLLISAAAVAWGEPPKLSITGPATVTAGSAVFLQVDTDAVAVDWIVFPTSGSSSFVPLTLYQGMRPDGVPILKYAAFFSSPAPGTYVFAVVGTKQDQLGKALHTLVNGKPGPNPNPDPDPDPDPQPPGHRFVLVVRESAQQSAAMAETLMGLRAYLLLQGHQYRIEDPQLPDSSGKTPAWFQDYLNRIAKAKVPLPALIVCAPGDAGNEVLAIVPLPANSADAIAVVKANGG